MVKIGVLKVMGEHAFFFFFKENSNAVIYILHLQERRK